jgi:hypothetical protein
MANVNVKPFPKRFKIEELNRLSYRTFHIILESHQGRVGGIFRAILPPR